MGLIGFLQSVDRPVHVHSFGYDVMWAGIAEGWGEVGGELDEMLFVCVIMCVHSSSTTGWARNYRHLWLCELSRAFACTRYLCSHHRSPVEMELQVLDWIFEQCPIVVNSQILQKWRFHRRAVVSYGSAAVCWSFCWFLDAAYCLWFRYWTVSCLKSLRTDIARSVLHYHNFFTCSHLFHWLYITVCYRQLLWMSLTSPLAMISTADSCRIARLCAQQLFERQKIATSKLLIIFHHCPRSPLAFL